MFNKKKNITVAGDVMLDQYWFGNVNRVSQEAPVPIVDITSEEFRPGGAANVAYNIASLGPRVKLFGIAGKDEKLKILKNTLKLKNLKTKFLSSNSTTINKLRIISKGNQMIRVDFEKTFLIKHQQSLLKMWEKDNSKEDLLVLSDYNKGSINPQDWIKVAVKKNIPIIVDPKGTNFIKYSGSTCITPNLSEFERVAGKVKNKKDLIDKSLDIMRKVSIKSILVTMSEKGMILILDNGKNYYFRSKAIEVNDVTGAGDTVISVFSTCLVSNYKINDAAKIANNAAGIVVSKIGTASIQPDELTLN